mgnify:CR=1 FL=1
MIDITHYTYRLVWSQEDQEHVALCSEFPSLSYLSDNPKEALEGIFELVKDVVRDMTENGETLPIPFSEKAFSGKFQVRIPPEQHRMLAIQAAEQGISLNRLAASKLAS